MSKSRKHNTLTPEQLRQYLAGQLSPLEQHGVERAMLDNPLYAEAIDGLELIQKDKIDSQKVNVSLQQALQKRLQKQKKQKAIPLWQSISVAAMVLVVLSMGTVFYLNQSEMSPKSESVALEGSSQPLDKQESTSAQADNLAAPKATAPLSIESKKQIAESKPVPQKTKIQAPQPLADEATIPESVPAALPPPPATAEPIIAKEETAIKADSTRAEAPKYAKMAAKQKPATEKEEKLSEKEVIDSEKDMKKALPGGGQQASKSKSPDNQQINDFQVYVRQNLQMPEEARRNHISGIVRVEFDVDNNGKPSHLRIVKSLGHGCDEEAMRLLKDGPVWQQDTSKAKRIVEIKFQ